MVKPLSEESKEKLMSAVCRSWFGTKEMVTVDALEGNATVTVEHTDDDELEFTVTIVNHSIFDVDEWPDKMNELGNPFIRLSAAVGALLGESVNYTGRVPFYKPPAVAHPKPMYRGSVDIERFSVTATI